MKYSEFKAEVEKMGFVVVDSGFPIYIDKSANGETLLSVGKNKRFWLDPGWGGFEQLEECQKLELYALGYKLAKTPLAEREEEKRYWLQKIPVPLLDKGTEKKWLWKYTRTSPSNMFGVDTTKIDHELYKTIFTESEIAEMDITGFKKIEVLDGE